MSAVVLLGWPAIIAALLLSAAGIRRARWQWLLIAAIAVAPVSLYLAATPRFAGVALLLPGLLAGAALAVRVSRAGLAWSLLAPVAGFFAWLAVIVSFD